MTNDGILHQPDEPNLLEIRKRNAASDRLRLEALMRLESLNLPVLNEYRVKLLDQYPEKLAYLLVENIDEGVTEPIAISWHVGDLKHEAEKLAMAEYTRSGMYMQPHEWLETMAPHEDAWQSDPRCPGQLRSGSFIIYPLRVVGEKIAD